MLEVDVLVADIFAANCYVVRRSGAKNCLVIDPGAGVLDRLLSRIAGQELVPQAVLLTHGHLDHIWTAGAVQQRFDVPVVVHAADAARLLDPQGTTAGSGQLAAALAAGLAQAQVEAYVPATPTVISPAAGERADLHGLGNGWDGTNLGFAVTAVGAPGHTAGSVLYVCDAVPAGPAVELESTWFTGDVLFAGSVGRTDLPGADPGQMTQTLARLARELPADSLLLPGHGPASSGAAELAQNPYLNPRAR